MIIELEKEHFKTVLPLNTYYNLEIAAILSRYNTGRVFVDDKYQPKTGIIWTDDGVFFIGTPHNDQFKSDLKDFIRKVAKPERQKFDRSNWYICSVSPEWDEAIKTFFEDNTLQMTDQHVYRIDNMRTKNFSVGAAEEGLRLMPISKELFDATYKNMDYFVEGILDFWPDVHTFCEKGLGYFLIKDDEILSRCTMDFRHNDIVTIGVATDENHRRKGYGQLVVKATLNQCKNQGYDPYWDCMDSNGASIALATSLGFHRDHTYTLFEVDLSSY